MRGWRTAPVLVDAAFFGHLDFRFKVCVPNCFGALGACTISVPLDAQKTFLWASRTVQLLVGEEEHRRILMSS